MDWRCEGCGSQIIMEKKQGSAFVHCNCLMVQALRISKMKPTTDAHGSEELMLYKHKKRFHTDGKMDQISAARRGLKD